MPVLLLNYYNLKSFKYLFVIPSCLFLCRESCKHISSRGVDKGWCCCCEQRLWAARSTQLLVARTCLLRKVCMNPWDTQHSLLSNTQTATDSRANCQYSSQYYQYYSKGKRFIYVWYRNSVAPNQTFPNFNLIFNIERQHDFSYCEDETFLAITVGLPVTSSPPLPLPQANQWLLHD